MLLSNLNGKSYNIIVIDDDKGLNSFDSDFKEDHLILTNSTVGLNSLATDEALLKISQLLNRVWSKRKSNPIPKAFISEPSN